MRFHVVGIGGAGMSAVARLLLAEGHEVSGSDSSDWPLARAVAGAGARVVSHFDAENVRGADVVVRSSAYGPEHPEVAEALRARIPVWRRQDAWRHLAHGKRVVAVAGTHGKTTTTALVFTALRAGGLDPSLVCGAELRDLGANAHAGVDPVLVIEADEYDRAFLELSPDVALVTNVDHDHVDHFPTREEYLDAFRELVGRLAAGGTVVACEDDSGARQIASWARHHYGWPVATYGTETHADWRLDDVMVDSGGTSFRLRTPLGENLAVRLRLLGAHNARNATGAIAAAVTFGVSAEGAAAALADFGGTSRRLETLGVARGVTVIDDYAHHPAEIRASILATRHRLLTAEGSQRLVAIFQPHTASRLRAFFDDFVAALRQADAAVVIETFASAREPADSTGGARALAGRAGARYAATNEEAARRAAELVREGDVVLVMGAGDVAEAGERLLGLLA